MTTKKQLEKAPKDSFSRSILINYSQILGTAQAYGVSPHRARLSKLQEIGDMKPNYINLNIKQTPQQQQQVQMKK